MENINIISDSYMCSNCGACATICPHNVIEYKKSSIGRHYAFAGDKCINCGLCIKVCPSLFDGNNTSADPYVGHVESVYVGQSNEKKIFRNGQSGGMATAILSYLFEKKLVDSAVVTVMSEGKTPSVKAKIITSIDQLTTSQKSCYTPVEVLSVLRNANIYETVALVGLPCHIEGLRLLQRKSVKFANVKYAIGLICDRTLCEGIQHVIASYCKETTLKFDWRRKDFFYQGKYYPYKSAPIVAYNSDGYMKVFPKYYRMSLKEMFTSPRCRVCKDKLNSCADIVLGDPWGMKEVDLKHGQSLVLTRTREGEAVLRGMIADGKATLNERTLSEVVGGQHIDDRRKQVEVFTNVMKIIMGETENINGLDTLHFQEEKTREAYNKLREFIELEKKEKREIVTIGRKIIRKASITTILKRNLFIRLTKKIIHIILKH